MCCISQISYQQRFSERKAVFDWKYLNNFATGCRKDNRLCHAGLLKSAGDRRYRRLRFVGKKEPENVGGEMVLLAPECRLLS